MMDSEKQSENTISTKALYSIHECLRPLSHQHDQYLPYFQNVMDKILLFCIKLTLFLTKSCNKYTIKMYHTQHDMVSETN